MDELKDCIKILDEEKLNTLVDRYINGYPFADKFIFVGDFSFSAFLDKVNISKKQFKKKYYFNKERKRFIAESDDGYVIISTLGLVPLDKRYDNAYFNAFEQQRLILECLINKIIEIVSNETIYNIDGYYYNQLGAYSNAIFHNVVFFLELLCKVYLYKHGNSKSLKSHDLSKLYNKVVDTMFSNNNNNSLFHIYYVHAIKELCRHIKTIPGDFKEQYIKYNDNKEDTTVFLFNQIEELRNIVELSGDFLGDLSETENHFFKFGFLEKALKKSKTEEERKHILTTYDYLLDCDKNKI